VSKRRSGRLDRQLTSVCIESQGSLLTREQDDHDPVADGGTVTPRERSSAIHSLKDSFIRVLRTGLGGDGESLYRGSGAVQNEEIVVVGACSQWIGPL
jgi:hypothetical protein